MMDMFYSLLAEYYSNIFIRRKLQGSFYERHFAAPFISIIWKFRVWLELNLCIFHSEYKNYLHFPDLLYEYGVMLNNVSQFIDTDVSKLNNYHNFYPVYIVKNEDTGLVDYIKYAVVIDTETVVAIIVEKKGNHSNVKTDLSITVKSHGKEIMFHYKEGTKDRFNSNIQKVLGKTLRRVIYRNTRNVLYKTVDKL